ncbi:MAG: hypothetical protein JWN30_253, partial [Bacilli bacterium]|nr:hypothetical protein [Bacilli bacterium]
MSLTVSHRLPGRLRLAIAGIQNQPVLAYKLQCALEKIPGIQDAQCNASSGRALIRFTENLIAEDQVLTEVRLRLPNFAGVAAWEETAATSELQSGTESDTLAAGSITLPEPLVRSKLSLSTQNPYRFSTIASASLFGLLSIKRLLVGRSAL